MTTTSDSLSESLSRSTETGGSVSTIQGALEAVQIEKHSPRLKNKTLGEATVTRSQLYSYPFKPVSTQNLPNEVLSAAFALACDQCGFFDRRLVTAKKLKYCHTFRTLLAITQVCAHWRRVAINTPVLWSHLDFIDSPKHTTLELYQLWLDRSRHAPIYMQAMIRRSRADDDVALDSFKIVLPHLPRTCSLEARSEKSNLSIQLVLLDWLTNGSPGSVKELSLRGHNEFGWNHHGWHLLSTTPLDQDYVDSFLAPRYAPFA
ncbi:F-box-like protein [Ceratobasidium sp. AG-Ba]|nr:F-box-like protein [Ceratobasidium sp. AG-Ba]